MNVKSREEISNLKPYVPGRPIEDVKNEYSLESVIKLASNENPYGCSSRAKQAIIDSLSSIELYPDGNCTLLREKLSKKFDIKENQLVFGCGTDEVISMISKVFVDKNDECITAETTFSQYASSVISMGGKMIYAKMKNNTFDLDEITEKITSKTKIIFLTNPNNPTGTVFNNDQQLSFLETVPNNVLVVIDEAYEEFADHTDFPNTLKHMEKFDNIILLKTFSKAYGMASLRIGYGISSSEIVRLFEKIRNPFNVSIPAQMAALYALDDTEFLKTSIEKNKEVLDYVTQCFKNMNLSYIPSQANFIMVDTKKDSNKLFIELMKKGYIVRPGSVFNMNTYLRISLGTLEEMEGFFKVFKEVLEN